MNDPFTRMAHLLALIYGEHAVATVLSALTARLEAFAASHPPFPPRAVLSAEQRLTERDALLITYGDQFREPGVSPLRTLRAFLDAHLSDALSGVHILPCFPYSSDDGFSVIDYRQVDPDLGDWEDVAALGERYRLMFDFVANHISQHSTWFRAFRRGEAPFSGYFIAVEPTLDLSEVVRPRALPLLTAVETDQGLRHVWTTFSDDQIDLNYGNPEVLLEMTDVLLHYVANGAEIIRLDAIAYLWKEPGTPCIHLPQTHAVVKLWRAVLDAVAPHVLLITETNVPHLENISYFGTSLPATGGTDEAQLVYNFSLGPLTLNALQSGDAAILSRWAAGLQSPSPAATFFNFIASHDGIGVLPARGFLSEAQVQDLAERTLAHGGKVSYKANSDGSVSAYELNITLYDFLNDPAYPDPAVDVPRFLTSQAILLSLAGLPGIYTHSLFGSRNCHTCFAETGRARSLNRQKFSRDALEASLADPAQHTGAVFEGYRRLLRLRREEPAFHPAGQQRVLDLGPALFAILRTPPVGGRPVLCLHNVSPHPQTALVSRALLETSAAYHDLLTDAVFPLAGDTAVITLSGYQTCWLVG
ncbi:MAG: sugar phosphorylase [Anaerolineae bacterium]|jgi:sucrose phosphorylase|nr:sugar phosphorylase [Anaerolineae bacterium]